MKPTIGFLICLLGLLASAPFAPVVASGFAISGGFSWPQSGVLEKYWDPGPTYTVTADLDWSEAATLGVGLRYAHFEYPAFRGYGTHSVGIPVNVSWRPRFFQKARLEFRTGVTGYWTSNVHQIPDFADGGPHRPPVGKLTGWGPTVGVGIGLVLMETRGALAMVHSFYDRSWGSEARIDELGLAVAILVPWTERPDS